jgi:hypothetical protein
MQPEGALLSDNIPCAAAGTLPGQFEQRIQDDLLAFSFTHPYSNHR